VLAQKLYARYTVEQLELVLDFLENAAVLAEDTLTEVRRRPGQSG
jgi:hypothetical protein